MAVMQFYPTVWHSLTQKSAGYPGKNENLVYDAKKLALKDGNQLIIS